MKKSVFACLLALAIIFPGSVSMVYAQAAPSTQITIKDPQEYTDYTNAIGQATPAAKAPPPLRTKFLVFPLVAFAPPPALNVQFLYPFTFTLCNALISSGVASCAAGLEGGWAAGCCVVGVWAAGGEAGV